MKEELILESECGTAAAHPVDSSGLVGVAEWDAFANWLNIVITAPTVWLLWEIDNKVNQRWSAILLGAWIGAYATWIIYTLYISRLLKQTRKTPTV